MKHGKKILALLVCVAMTAVLAVGCGSSKSALDTIKEKGTLVWGTNAAFPPFESKDGDGNVVGVDAEIAKAIADELGVKLVVEDMEFDSLPAALKSGKIDIIGAGYTENDERLQEMDFSSKYFTAKQIVVVKKGNKAITDKDSLAGKKIGVQTGTTGDTQCASKIEGAEVSRYDSMQMACEDVKNGKLDCVIGDNLTIGFILNKMDGELEIVEGVSYEDEEYGFAVKKGDTELNEVVNKVIDKLKSEGQIDQWVNKYNVGE
ncbi:MAG: basic amino acid ABC transporter substrate-binding protein [Christensenellales bacterium]